MSDDKKSMNLSSGVRTTLSARNLAESIRTIHEDFSMIQAIEQIREIQKGIQPMASAIADATRAFRESSTARQILEIAESNKAIMRAVVGPFEELLHGASALKLAWQDDMELIRQTVEGFESRFRLPEIAESIQMIEEFRANAASVVKQFTVDTSSLKLAMDTMRTPWLDIHQVMQSTESFAELQSIGQVLKNMSVFEESVAAALRINLGDWRDRITWPDNISTDLAARSEFYVKLGFNPALTNFPAPAFRQSLEIAGLKHQPPPAIDQYTSPAAPALNDDEEKGFVRTNVAHDWLQRLESHIRRFVDELMTRQFGLDWPRNRLPNGLYDRWQEKKRTAVQSGAREQPLIAYADFTDYELVICKRDNWREIFASFFRRPESVRESFQRLYPVRLDTMHARIITQDDELLLRAEVTRLLKVVIF
jgi:hypothetical protein